jgi:four helix bundle protein
LWYAACRLPVQGTRYTEVAIRHFFISKGSTAELITQLIIANEIGYIDDITKIRLVDECDKISAMLAKLIKVRMSNVSR